VRRLAALLALSLAFGCASANGPGGEASQVRNPDPWEPINRGLFAFNEGFDRFLLGPVAKGWDFIAPEVVQKGVYNFYNNLNMPIVFANDLLMLRPDRAAEDFVRTMINSTLGIGGLIDVASRLDVPDNDSDFGLTLAYWGMPTGPYFVIPLLGPSTVRDTVGVAAAIPMQPYSYFLPFWGNVLVRVPYFINLRAYFDDEIEQSRRDAFDYYVFVRNAYLQNRRYKAQILRGDDAAEAEEEDDLYYFDDDDPDAEAQLPEKQSPEKQSPEKQSYPAY